LVLELDRVHERGDQLHLLHILVVDGLWHAKVPVLGDDEERVQVDAPTDISNIDHEDEGQEEVVEAEEEDVEEDKDEVEELEEGHGEGHVHDDQGAVAPGDELPERVGQQEQDVLVLPREVEVLVVPFNLLIHHLGLHLVENEEGDDEVAHEGDHEGVQEEGVDALEDSHNVLAPVVLG